MAQDNNGNKKKDDTDKKGFASMDPKKQKEIARKGGETSHSGSSNKNSESNKDNESDSSSKR